MATFKKQIINIYRIIFMMALMAALSASAEELPGLIAPGAELTEIRSDFNCQT